MTETRYGFVVVLIGLLLVTIVFLVSTWKWSSAADVATAVGSITGVFGTIIGAFFGHQLGAAGKEKAEQQRDKAEAKAFVLAAITPPDKIEGLRTTHANLFSD